LIDRLYFDETSENDDYGQQIKRMVILSSWK